MPSHSVQRRTSFEMVGSGFEDRSIDEDSHEEYARRDSSEAGPSRQRTSTGDEQAQDSEVIQPSSDRRNSFEEVIAYCHSVDTEAAAAIKQRKADLARAQINHPARACIRRGLAQRPETDAAAGVKLQARMRKFDERQRELDLEAARLAKPGILAIIWALLTWLLRKTRANAKPADEEMGIPLENIRVPAPSYGGVSGPLHTQPNVLANPFADPVDNPFVLTETEDDDNDQDTAVAAFEQQTQDLFVIGVPEDDEEDDEEAGSDVTPITPGLLSASDIPRRWGNPIGADGEDEEDEVGVDDPFGIEARLNHGLKRTSQLIEGADLIAPGIGRGATGS